MLTKNQRNYLDKTGFNRAYQLMKKHLFSDFNPRTGIILVKRANMNNNPFKRKGFYYQ